MPRAGPHAVALRLLGDDMLARRAADGDQQAFAAIYERYHQQLYRYCRSILRDPDDAGDALQNTMVGALRAMHRRQPGSLKGWLYRIAFNESISLARRRPGTTTSTSWPSERRSPSPGIPTRPSAFAS